MDYLTLLIMNKKQEQRLNSLRVIYSIAMDRQEIISKVELFREGIEALGKVIDDIETVGSQQCQDISGVNVQKLMARDVLMDHLVNIAGDIRAYATLIQSYELYESANIKKGKLMSMHQQNLISTGMFLIEEVKKIPMSFLAKGGYTEADLKAIESSYEEFYMLYTEPRMRINERKGQTRQLILLFKKAMEIKKGTLDNHINKFRLTDPGFHQMYKDAAHVIKRG